MKKKKKKKVWLVIGIGNPLVSRRDRERVRETDFYEWGTLNDVVKTSNRDFLENS